MFRVGTAGSDVQRSQAQPIFFFNPVSTSSGRDQSVGHRNKSPVTHTKSRESRETSLRGGSPNREGKRPGVVLPVIITGSTATDPVISYLSDLSLGEGTTLRDMV